VSQVISDLRRDLEIERWWHEKHHSNQKRGGGPEAYTEQFRKHLPFFYIAIATILSHTGAGAATHKMISDRIDPTTHLPAAGVCVGVVVVGYQQRPRTNNNNNIIAIIIIALCHHRVGRRR
jgi:hypothetical protein